MQILILGFLNPKIKIKKGYTLTLAYIFSHFPSSIHFSKNAEEVYHAIFKVKIGYSTCWTKIDRLCSVQSYSLAQQTGSDVLAQILNDV